MRKTVVALVLLQAGGAFAAAAPVTDLSVRQRWPWSPKVDIVFTVGEGEKSDIELSATWDGHPEPLPLTAANGLAGRSYGLAGGQGHVVWDPRSAGITNALTGFKVSAESVAVALHQRPHPSARLHRAGRQRLVSVQIAASPARANQRQDGKSRRTKILENIPHNVLH